MAGLSADQGATINRLVEKFGADNVQVHGETGHILIVPGGDVQRARLLNKEGMDLGDIAAFTGAALPAAAGLAAGLAMPATRVGGMAGAALRAMVPAAVDTAAEAGREVATELMPGDNPSTLEDSVRRVGSTGLLATGAGLGAEALGAATLAGRRTLSPNARAQRLAANAPGPSDVDSTSSMVDDASSFAQERTAAERAAFAREGVEISQETGIPLSPGQISGDRLQLSLEDLARNFNSPMGIGSQGIRARMANYDDKQLEAITRRLGALSRKASADAQTAEQVGDAVSDSVLELAHGMIEKRSLQGAVDFAVVDQAAGGARVVRFDNFMEKLDKLIEGSRGLGGQLDADGVALLRYKNGLTAGFKDGEEFLASGQEMQNQLKRLGKAATGSGGVFAQMDSAAQRRPASELLEALGMDLENAATDDAASGEVVDALRAARNNWRQNSEQIQELRDSAIGKLIGEGNKPAPEIITRRVLTLPPSDMRKAVALLNEPSRNALKRGFLDRMIDAGSAVAGSGGVSTRESQFSINKLLTQYNKPENRRTLAILFGGKEAREIDRTMRVIQRVADVGNTSGSRTAPMLMTLMGAGAGGSAIASGINPALGALIGFGSRLFTMDRVVRAVENPQARQAIEVLSKPNATSRMTNAAIATLGGVLWKQREEEREQRREIAEQAQGSMSLPTNRL